MPIKPEPFECICMNCGWRKTYSPKSDTILEPFAVTCPKCGSDKLKTQSLSPMKEILDTFKNLLSNNSKKL